ncbi:MAG: Cof-type HAD-IIB family hydrolase [Lachnospiraceae bacterium]|nr:Cof-type HAD-IIB family hydrolase [Lachnospiraceae bacterium]
MIKLIATDVDGTLVKDSARDMYEELLDAVEQLYDRGIHFAVASGRQYTSIRRMFERVADKISYIAENGAHLVVGGRDLSVTLMKREYVEQIMEDLRSLYPQDCHVVASTPKGCYLESRDEYFIRLIRDSYRNDVLLTDDILKEQTDIIKLAVYRRDTLREIGESFLIPKWKDRVKCCMAGEEWVDFMGFGVDKGKALGLLQSTLGVTPEETMAFGDNNNDKGLMLAAGESYAVENAVAEVKAAAKYSCPSYEHKGVYQVLKREFGL